MFAFVLLLFAQAASQGDSSRTDSMLAVGIAQYKDGDFETAVFTLDTVIRRLQPEPRRSSDLARAYLYLGAAYVGLDHEPAARGKIREALKLDPRLSITREDYSARVVEVFKSEQTKLKATAGQKRRRWAAITIGAGTLAGMGAVGKHYLLPPPEPPSHVSVTVPFAEVVRSVTRVTPSGIGGGDRPLTYDWDFGDGTTASGETVSHVYDREGTFTIRLTLRNEAGTASAAEQVRVRGLSGPWAYSVSGGEDPVTCTQTGSRLDCAGAASNRDFFGSWYTLADPHQVVGGEVRMRFGTFRCIGGELFTDRSSGEIVAIFCVDDLYGANRVLRRR